MGPSAALWARLRLALPSQLRLGRRLDWPRNRVPPVPRAFPKLCPLTRHWQAADFLGVHDGLADEDGLPDALLLALSKTLAARTPDEGMAFLGLRRPDASACSAASARALLEKHAVRRAPAR